MKSRTLSFKAIVHLLWAMPLVIAGCLFPPQIVKEMHAFHDRLAVDYPCFFIDLGVTSDTVLQVTLINSRYEDSSKDVKAQVADRIGTLSDQYFDKENKPHAVTVTFLKSDDKRVDHIYIKGHTTPENTYTAHKAG